MPGMFNCAAEAVIEKEGMILLAQRSHESSHAAGKWETITGRVEQGESFEEAVLREVKEEVDLQVEVVMPFDTFHFHRGEEKADT
jgi:8-oxo-dGTP diphosphatase